MGLVSPSAQQRSIDLLRAALDLRVAALHASRSRASAVLAPAAMRAGRAAAHADAHARPAELDEQRAGGEAALVDVWLAPMLPRPPAIMMGLW
jgi:hypothetical protein